MATIRLLQITPLPLFLQDLKDAIETLQDQRYDVVVSLTRAFVKLEEAPMPKGQEGKK